VGVDQENKRWRDRWAQNRDGEDCVLCGRSDIDEDEWGIRVFNVKPSTGSLGRRASSGGTSWRCGSAST
jgi:HIT domain